MESSSELLSDIVPAPNQRERGEGRLENIDINEIRR